MRAILQRVLDASVVIDGQRVASIGHGLLIFVAIKKGDTIENGKRLINKVVNLRVFSNEDGLFDLSAAELKVSLMVVSQFTLYADTSRGRRPSFVEAEEPDKARIIFSKLIDAFIATGLNVRSGRFQETMEVNSTNDGPVTIMIDS